MRMNPSPARPALALFLLTGGLGIPAFSPTPARAETPTAETHQPAVARAHFSVGSRTHEIGTVFFLAIPSATGAAAVGAAHSYPLAELTQTEEVTFRLASSGQRVARSTRFLTPPGRSFRSPDTSLREDFVVFALDDLPFGVRVLTPVRQAQLKGGQRVRLLGVPSQVGQDEDDVFGTLVRATPDRLEIDLDAHTDLRGWGGAPVLIADTEQVLGLLEAAWPEGNKLRVAAAPITGVLLALQNPLQGGLGTPFADFAGKVSETANNASKTKSFPDALTELRGNDGATASEVATPEVPATDEGRSPAASKAAAATTSESVAASGSDGATRSRKSLLGNPQITSSELSLSVEHPEDGTIIGDANGAFIAGRALAMVGKIRLFDLIFVLDTSHSTSDPAGADVNGNGVLGQARLGGLGGLFGMGSSDPGDSILAAEVSAARQILRGLDPRTTRVGLVTFAGEPQSSGGVIVLGRVEPPAVTEEALTVEYDHIERALQRVISRGPRGSTHMAAGVDQSTIELLGLRGALSDPRPEAEKIVLFFTDGQPTLPYDAAFMADNVKAVLRAAERAHKAGVRIHSFAIGEEALEGPIATVEMAARTEGYFTPVRDPADLANVIEEVNFTEIEELRVRNLTTEQDAPHITLNLDGSYAALLPLCDGKNRVEIYARASNGKEGRKQLTLSYAPEAPLPPLPEALVAQRNRLLEQRLLELRLSRLETEREVVERTRRELLVEIERERSAARERAERQRKELDLEVGEDTP